MESLTLNIKAFLAQGFILVLKNDIQDFFHFSIEAKCVEESERTQIDRFVNLELFFLRFAFDSC